MKMVLLVVIQFAITIIATLVIMSHIEKHSVHPQHGNFVETAYKCQPWDSCR